MLNCTYDLSMIQCDVRKKEIILFLNHNRNEDGGGQWLHAAESHFFLFGLLSK